MAISPPPDESRFWATPGPELVTESERLLKQIRLHQAELLGLVARMSTANVAVAAGYPSLPAFLEHVLHIDRRAAANLVANAAATAETLTPTGHLTPAPLPTARVAMLDGAIDLAHLDVIADAVGKLPIGVSTADREVVEAALADYARTASPQAVRRLGFELHARLDADGTAPQEEKLAQPTNSLRYRRTRDGRMELAASLDPEAAEELEVVVTALAKPPEPGPDARSPNERLGDAFAELIHLAARIPDPGKGTRCPQVTVTFEYDRLLGRLGRHPGGRHHPAPVRRPPAGL